MSKRKAPRAGATRRGGGFGTMPSMPALSGYARRELHARGDPRSLRAHRRGARRQASSTSRQAKHAIREDLNPAAPPASWHVLRPLRVVTRERSPSTDAKRIDGLEQPEDAAAGTARCRSPGPRNRARRLPRGTRRSSSPLAPGARCWLRYAYFVKWSAGEGSNQRPVRRASCKTTEHARRDAPTVARQGDA